MAKTPKAEGRTEKDSFGKKYRATVIYSNSVGFTNGELFERTRKKIESSMLEARAPDLAFVKNCRAHPWILQSW